MQVCETAGACLDSKVKFGCALWNIAKNVTAMTNLDRIKPRLLKRVMQVPSSTPNIAIQYEFGINDLSLEVLMEKVILAVQTLKLGDERVSKQLFERMFEKDVSGFCSEVKETCKILNVTFSGLLSKNDIRKYMKDKIIEIQGKQLLGLMVMSSKMDRVLLNGFKYDGKIRKYLSELDFLEARAVFMARFRMIPTKMNFPGRWNGVECNVCGFQDTDVHIFTCPGYTDLNPDNISLDVFWDEMYLEDMKLLSDAAKVVIKIITRAEEIQNMV